MPEIPMICDPSHISGCTELIQEVSQKALDLNYDGLIIESHCNPAKAWSDAKQQLTPNELRDMLSSLVLRIINVNPSLKTDLDEYRQQIDKYDDDLLAILEERMRVAKLIGKYKKEHNMTILQPNRWDEIIKKTVDKGATFGLSEEFISTIFKAIHQESINKQIQVMNDEEQK